MVKVLRQDGLIFGARQMLVHRHEAFADSETRFRIPVAPPENGVYVGVVLDAVPFSVVEEWGLRAIIGFTAGGELVCDRGTSSRTFTAALSLYLSTFRDRIKVNVSVLGPVRKRRVRTETLVVDHVRPRGRRTQNQEQNHGGKQRRQLD
jgi:hypothetical protein